MTQNLTDKIADRYTRRNVDLHRFAEDVRQKTLGYLEQLRLDLENEINRASPSAPALTKFRRMRLEKLLETTKNTIKTAYREMSAVSRAELKPLARSEGNFAVSAINAAVSADVVSIVFTEQQVSALMSDLLIQGAPLIEGWDRLDENFRRAFADEMRQGVLRGETNAELIRRVRGTATGKRHSYWLDDKRETFTEFRGGILETGTRQAEALVRTAVQSVSNAANYATLQENSDVIKGVQALVTLDNRTSRICQARGSASWDLETGEPLAGTNESFPGAPPWHWQCRTFLVPVLKSWEELSGRKTREIPMSTRASMNGQVAADLGYEAWLKTQGKEVQLDVLGRGRYKLWESGKLTLPELINQRGRPLTLKELEEKNV